MAETNLIKNEDLVRAREVDFVYRFNDGITKLLEALGVTRKIPKVAGTNLKAYKATGTLQDGRVAEGEIIPLSHYKTEPVTFGEISLSKWRKATSVEAIIEKGFDQAVTMTTDRMLKDVQSEIKRTFFNFLKNGMDNATGINFQSTLASIWSRLQVDYEDTDFEAVYFINPLDLGDYLGSAAITTQSAFGFTYISDFLGLGTVILNSNVPVGTIYGTAKENIILYYVPVNGADVGKAFTFTADQLGYIGIHEESEYTNLTSADTVLCGITLFAERLDGIVIGKISDGGDDSGEGGEDTPRVTLDKTTASLNINDTVTLNATTVPEGTSVSWASSDNTVASIAGASSSSASVKGNVAGTATITAKATIDGTEYTATCVVTVAGA